LGTDYVLGLFSRLVKTPRSPKRTGLKPGFQRIKKNPFKKPEKNLASSRCSSSNNPAALSVAMGGRHEDPVNAHFTYAEEAFTIDQVKKTRRRVTCDHCGESKVFANVGRMRMHLSGDAEIVNVELLHLQANSGSIRTPRFRDLRVFQSLDFSIRVKAEVTSVRK
jgi:hypothetical protein